jgi:hypothetical protein
MQLAVVAKWQKMEQKEEKQKFENVFNNFLAAY